MNSLKYCPPLRFTRENGEVYPNWEERPLSEYLVEYTEKTLIKNQYPVLTSSRAGLVLQTEHFNGQVTTEDNIGYHVIPYGYFTYRSRSDDGRFVFNRNTLIDKGIVSYFYPVFYVNGADPYFVWIYLNNFLSRQIVREIVGTSQLVLSFNKLKNLTIKIPSLPEQEKISSFFSLLDQKIEKQQEKIEQLELFKKGMLQKIFSQEIRFKDENGQEFPEWEQSSIGDFLKIRHGKSQKQIEDPKGKFPILATGGEIGRTNTPLYSKPSVLIGRKGTINKPQYMETPFWTVDTLFFSEISERVSPKFVYYLFNQINWLMYNEASGVPSLSAATIESIECEIPSSIMEQTRIAEFLSAIDRKIENEQKKMNYYNEQRKYFLRHMFM